MGYSSYIGSRYLRPKRKQSSISAITFIAVVGVALGVSVLSVVMAISSGFEDEFTRKVLGVNAHVLIMKYGYDFTEYRDVLESVQGDPGVRGAAPFVIQEMMISFKDRTSGVLLKGVDPERIGQVLDLPEHIVEGGLDGLRLPGARPPHVKRFGDDTTQEETPEEPPNPTDSAEQEEAPSAEASVAPSPEPPGIVIGRTLAENLSAEIGDVLQVTTPLIGLDVLGWSPSDNTPKSRSFKVVGIFYAGFLEYDTKLAYVDYFEAQRFFNHGDSVTGVEVTLHDTDRGEEYAQRFEEELGGGPFHTIDWQQLNESLFMALKLQKLVLTILLAFIILVAALNIIATLVMMVIDRRHEIAILKSMGATHGGILKIFVHVGVVVGLYGIAIGLGVGFLVCYGLHEVGWPLDPDVYLIDHLPVRLNWIDFVVTGLVAFVICTFSTIVPALSASWLRPVEVLQQD